MKILIVGLVKNPQLNRLKQEAEKKGHHLEGCYSSDLIIKTSPQEFTPLLKDKDITSYDLIYLWAISKRRWEWYTAAHYLNQKHNIKILNQKIIDPSYLYFLSPASDYLKQFKNKLPFPKSAIVFNAKTVDTVIKDFSFPLILKDSLGRQGKGIFKVNSLVELKTAILQGTQQNNTSSFVIREFIPNDGDIRIFTVGYKAIGAMKRTPKSGDFRSNISQGGSGNNFNLSEHPQVQKIAEKLSQLTKTEIAGVDIMLHQKTQQPYILEINPGPQFTGFEKYTKINAAQKIIEYFEAL